MNSSANSTALWPLVVYFGGMLLVVASMLGLSYILGQHHWERATGEPYEGGMLPTGSARLRVAAPFYLVAIFFLLFDLEAVYLFAWAVRLAMDGKHTPVLIMPSSDCNRPIEIHVAGLRLHLMPPATWHEYASEAHLLCS